MTTHVLRWIPTTWTFLVPFFLAACATYAPFPPPDEGEPPEAGLSLGQFCERLPDAHCRWQIDCDAGTQEWCDLVKDDYARPCEAVGASVAAGRIVFDRSRPGTCFGGMTGDPCILNSYGASRDCRLLYTCVATGAGTATCQSSSD
jgi:hypothetical protein